MGSTGPIPDRSDQRVRRNKPDVPIQKVTAIGAVPIPDLGITDEFAVHPLVNDLYQSLKDSAQSKYYEPSDWHYARLALHFVNRLLWSSRPSSEMLTTVNSMLTSLLMTEGDRRRVRLEIERKPPGEAGQQEATVADMFKQRLGAV